MQYDFTHFIEREKEIFEWLGDEYAQIQSGRITTAILDRVTIQMYGAKAMLTHSATVTAEDPKTLLVTPYDPSFLPDIEAALRAQVPTMESQLVRHLCGSLLLT